MHQVEPGQVDPIRRPLRDDDEVEIADAWLEAPDRRGSGQVDTDEVGTQDSLKADRKGIGHGSLGSSVDLGLHPPTSPRSTNWPNPRSPTAASSRITARPRTNTLRTAPATSIPSYGVKSLVWWRPAARMVRRAAGSSRTRSASRPGSIAPLRVRPKRRAGVAARRSTIRSTVIRPFATPSPYTTARSVSIPGAPLLILSNETPRAASPFSTATRSATWSVAMSERSPAASPAQSASTSAAERRGGEITLFAHSSGSGSSYRASVRVR